MGNSELKEAQEEELPQPPPESYKDRSGVDDAAWGSYAPDADPETTAEVVSEGQLPKVNEQVEAGDPPVVMPENGEIWQREGSSAHGDINLAEADPPAVTREEVDNAAWGNSKSNDISRSAAENNLEEQGGQIEFQDTADSPHVGLTRDSELVDGGEDATSIRTQLEQPISEESAMPESAERSERWPEFDPAMDKSLSSATDVTDQPSDDPVEFWNRDDQAIEGEIPLGERSNSDLGNAHPEVPRTDGPELAEPPAQKDDSEKSQSIDRDESIEAARAQVEDAYWNTPEVDDSTNAANVGALDQPAVEYEPLNPSESIANSEGDSVDSGMEQLGTEVRDVVDPTEWADHPEERAEMLELAHQHISDRFGLENAPPLQYSQEMKPDLEYGQYDFTTEQVTMGSWMLERDTPEDALATVVHEDYHAYQDAVISGKVVNLNETQRHEWDAASKSYTPPQVDFDSYRDNPLERDAFDIERPFLNGYRRTAR